MNKTIKIEGFKVQQLTSKPIAIASIGFQDLRKIVKFTYREPQNYDPFNPEKSIEEVTEDINKDYYQRLTNDKRLSSIYSFLVKEINNIISTENNAIGSFPTAIIISMDINQDIETEEELIDLINQDEYSGALYNENGNKIELVAPANKVSLIVDGQHRLSAMIQLYEDAKNNSIRIGRNSLKTEYPKVSNDLIIKHLERFELNCTLLLGFDKWEQGKVFADVNFNQKPVNKSLYYDIFGSFPDPNKNDIFLAHMLAMHLNNNSNSVIQNSIKMLGSGKGYFSQAFFVEALLEHFGKNGIWNTIPMDYLNGGSEYKILPKILKAYLKAVKLNFEDFWPKEGQDTSRKYPHNLLKTTGMGALLKLIAPIYRKYKTEIDFKSISIEDLTSRFENELKKASVNGSKYFSNEGEFSGSGSKGLQNKLFIKLGTDLGYFNK